MGKKLTKEEIELKESYKDFFRRFKNARGVSYSALIDSRSDSCTLSNFINDGKELRISINKLEQLKKEIITNFKKTYNELKDLLEEE